MYHHHRAIEKGRFFFHFHSLFLGVFQKHNKLFDLHIFGLSKRLLFETTTNFPTTEFLQSILGGGDADTDDNEGLPNLLSLFEVSIGARRNLGEEEMGQVMPQFELLAAATTWIGHGMDQLMEVGSTIRRHLEEVGQL